MRLLLLTLLLAAGASAQDRLPGTRPANDLVSWRFWWELNREVHGSFRRVAPAKALEAEEREAIRDALRSRALYGDQESRVAGRVAIQEASLGDMPRLRAAASVALGRAGDDSDVHWLIQVIDNLEERMIVKDACAVALLARGRLRDDKARAALTERLTFWLQNARALFVDDNFPTLRHVQPSITHALLAAAAGHHARGDPALLPVFADAVRKPPKRTVQYAEGLLFACGLAENEVLGPELATAAGRGPFAHERSLSDPSRSMAVYALARTGRTAAPALLRCLTDGRTQIEARRAAALGLGRLLREGPLDGDAEQALVATLHSRGQPVVAGFAAIAMGAASPPIAVEELWKVLDDSPDAARRPYVALALGLALQVAPTQERATSGRRLVDALEREREPETEAALCIACGLARAPARDALLERAAREAEGVIVQSAAIQGLGLLAENDPRTRDALREALMGKDPNLVEDAAISLFQIGDDGLDELLLRLLREATGTGTKDDTRVACMRAIGRFRVVEAAPTLRRILGTEGLDGRVRESAATALGFLASPEPSDLILDALRDYNMHAPTEVTGQLLWLSGSVATITYPDGGKK